MHVRCGKLRGKESRSSPARSGREEGDSDWIDVVDNRGLSPITRKTAYWSAVLVCLILITLGAM